MSSLSATNRKWLVRLLSALKKGIKVNVTLCFSANQALLAARAGAYFISPFVGRLDDINQDGSALVAEIVEMYHMQGLDTKVLAASCAPCARDSGGSCRR